jgi:hypothetical protein
MAPGTGGERNKVMMTKRFVALLAEAVMSAVSTLALAAWTRFNV